MIEIDLTDEVYYDPFIYLNGFLLTSPREYIIHIASNGVDKKLELYCPCQKNDWLMIASFDPKSSIMVPPIRLFYAHDGSGFISCSNPMASRQLTFTSKKAYSGKFVGCEPEPQNNDGRNACYWCNGVIKKVQGFSSIYYVCEACGK